MRELGTISQIFRYPVKSMLGEALEASSVGIDGLPGDRAWGVRDELRGDFFVGKRSAALMGCQACYVDPPSRDPGVPEIRLPNGARFRADSDEAAPLLSELVGREVTLWPVVPRARDVAPSDGRSLEDEMKEMMARTEDEPMPDFSDPLPALLEVYARGGPFFDAFPISLMSRRSIESIAAATPESAIDVRRFRPSLLLDTTTPGAFPEQEWIGHRVRIGDCVMAVQSTIVRCVMTTHGFADLPKDPLVMRTLVREAAGNLGVYASVEESGEIRRGDVVTLLD